MNRAVPHASGNRAIRNVLIVEDTDPCAATLEIALSKIDSTEIVAVQGGQQAWRYLQAAGAGEICAMVTDLHMPGMDGFELIERVRGDERYTEMPIIVISGCTDPKTPARVVELGANAFFEKPYSPVRVRATLEQLLNGTQVRHQT
jgi:two-component system chemotaxis response regulator CheY